MTPITGLPPERAEADTALELEREFERELAEIEAESLGWQPLGSGAYLHVGSQAEVIEVVGVATAAMAGCNVLWIS